MNNGHITQIFHHYLLHMQISFVHIYYDFYRSLTISQVFLVLIMSVVEGYFHECAVYKSRVFAALHFAPTSSNTTFQSTFCQLYQDQAKKVFSIEEEIFIFRSSSRISCEEWTREGERDRNYRNMFWKLFIGEGFFELLLEI